MERQVEEGKRERDKDLMEGRETLEGRREKGRKVIR